MLCEVLDKKLVSQSKNYDSARRITSESGPKNKLLSNHKLTMPNAEVDEAEIAKLVSDRGLKPEKKILRSRHA